VLSIPKEVQKLCNRLQDYITQAEGNPKLKGTVKQNCLAEIEMTEILVAAKYRTTPLSTRLLFKMALNRQLPHEVRQILEGGDL